MAESSFRGALGFFAEIGIFDVVLPFLLVFTIVFAMLEKTKIFGMEKHGDHEYTRKNLNALTAFVIAFFVIASSQLVATITEISANVVILMLAAVFFLLLVGTFHQEPKDHSFFLGKNMTNLFIVIMFIGLVGIFLNALTAGGRSWLDIILGWLSQFFTSDIVASVILAIIVIVIMYFIIRGGDRHENASK